MKFSWVIIAIVVYIFSIVLKTIRKEKLKKAQRGGQNTNNSPNGVQNFFDNINRAIQQQVNSATNQTTSEPTTTTSGSTDRTTHLRNLEEEGQSHHYRQLEAEGAKPKKDLTDPFLEDENSGLAHQHFNEVNLVDEYKRLHDKGKQLTHHSHEYFDEKKDRAKAASHRPTPFKRASSTRSQRQKATDNQIKETFLGKGGMKKAIILSEILKRPEW